MTLEDYERGTIDEDLTDARQHRHRAALYRQGLARHFTDMGGGLWLSHRAQVPLFALEARTAHDRSPRAAAAARAACAWMQPACAPPCAAWPARCRC